MKCKLKFSTVIVFTYVIAILFDYRLFYLGNISGLLSQNEICTITSILGIVLCFICYQRYRHYNVKLFNCALKISSLILLYWGAIVLYSVVNYPKQPVIYSVVQHISILYFVWTIPLLSFLYSSKGYKGLFETINVIVFIWYILLVIQYFYWLKTGNLIFNNILFSNVRTRTYGIRIGLGSLGNIMILYNFNKLVNMSRDLLIKIWYFIQFALGLFCLIFIQQTRAFSAIVFLSMAIIVFSGAKKISKKIILYSFLFIVIAYIIYTGILYDFFVSFKIDESNREFLGTSLRIDAIQYYLECFRKSIIFGNGFTSDKYYPLVQYKFSGSFNLLFYSDVGIFGLLGETGIGVVFFYIIPLLTMIKILIKNKLMKNSFILSLVAYVLLTSFTLIITDVYRAIAFPLIFAIFLYESDKKINNM